MTKIEQLNFNSSHLFKKILQAEENLYPFPHCIIEQALNTEDYDKVLQLNPFSRMAGSDWLKKGKGFNPEVTPYFLRKQFNFPRDFQKLRTIDKSFHDFWKDFYTQLISEGQLLKLLVEKFERYFLYRFGYISFEDDFHQLVKTQVFLQRHEVGYFIGPHTDIGSRIATVIFSFAYDENYIDYGTKIYVPKDRLVECSGRPHHSFSDFEEVSLAPYKPNNLFIFLKTKHSFHGVDEIPEGIPGDRYGMQIQFYEPNGGLKKDLSKNKKEEVKKKVNLGQKIINKLRFYSS